MEKTSDEKMNQLVTTWQRAYKLLLNNHFQYKRRLDQLLSWDKAREDNKTETRSQGEGSTKLAGVSSKTSIMTPKNKVPSDLFDYLDDSNEEIDSVMCGLEPEDLEPDEKTDSTNTDLP